MKKIVLKKLNEEVLYEKLPCGLEVYLFKTNKSKNFYITISTYYGSNVIKYKKGSKTYQVTPGSAHFLEHKVMNFNYDTSSYEIINALGSFGNAYTTYEGTNYNIFGNNDINKNISLLYDLVFKAKINQTTVESEKGIIKEEISMNDDDIDVYLYTLLNKNMFSNSYIVNHVLGNNVSIDNMNEKELNRIYKDFYIPSNMFTVVVGSFNENEVMKNIRNYFKEFKYKKYDIKSIKGKERDEVVVPYTEINRNVNISKVGYGIKININDLKSINKENLDNYFAIMCDSLFGQTSDLREKYVKEELIITLDVDTKIVDGYAAVYFFASTNKPDEFISRIKKDTEKFYIDEKTFIRKKKVIISNLIMSFESLEDIENYITTEKICYNKLNSSYYDAVNDLKYKEFERILSICNNKNNSIIKVVR